MLSFDILFRLKEKESEVSKLNDELNSKKTEVEKMKEAIEQQKAKNNVSDNHLLDVQV